MSVIERSLVLFSLTGFHGRFAHISYLGLVVGIQSGPGWFASAVLKHLSPFFCYFSPSVFFSLSSQPLKDLLSSSLSYIF
ncbi:hypothetical protein N657DRAFT_128690 [Parathielavia appendiculata]|uniref:Uncharacterized protein n=1 Tax=Parathielavia appendiculata TaxID=2587402 RepID=A0AAN6TVI0_9PEZI|nr:hypothetical protein N657DRAFT_128690 [Parathielavia appendiculata]